MNKFLFHIISFLMISSYSFSQSFDQSAGASIFLLSPISITASTGDLDFGEIILTGAPIISTIDPTIQGKKFVVQGSATKSVQINFVSIDIDNNAWAAPLGAPNGIITFTPDVIIRGGPTITSGDTIALPDVGGLGELDLWVGGSISIAAAQAHGDYTGLFTITVNY